MPTTKTEGVHAGEFLLSEAKGSRSREEVELAITEVDLPAGQILGMVTATSLYAPYDPLAEDGTETAVAVLFSPKPISEATQRATVVVRDAELIDTRLIGLDDDAEASLEAAGLIVRAGTP